MFVWGTLAAVPGNMRPAQIDAMKPSSRLRPEDIARFRLRRHHLLEEPPADAVTLCRDVCGVQAQVMSAAYLQLWARNHAISKAEISHALWQTRTLVKTSLMRQTLHLIPADEFALYIAALRPSRVAQALRAMARCGVDREEGEALTPLIMDALSQAPLGRAAIAAAVRPKVSKRVRVFMENSWSMIRIPIAEGQICYGAGEGNEVVYVRTDRWLPNASRPKNKMSVTEAQCALFRKYLRAYGPATPADFSHWAGIPMQEAKALGPLLESELVDVFVDQKRCLLLREDLDELQKDAKGKVCIRLLPNFDTYLLAHHDKEHLLSKENYKRVYRNQGWISAVVLVDGEIAGVWSYKPRGKKLAVEVEPFGKLSKVTRAGIEREAGSLAAFFERELKLKIVEGRARL